MGGHRQHKNRVLNPYPLERAGPKLLPPSQAVVRNCQLLLRKVTRKALDRRLLQLLQHRQLSNILRSLSCALIMATFSRNMCLRNLRFLLVVLQTATFCSRRTNLPRVVTPPCPTKMGNMSYMMSAVPMVLLSMDSSLKKWQRTICRKVTM